MVLIQIDFSFSSLYEWLNNVFGFCDNLLTKNVFYPLSGYKISAFLPALVVQEAWLIAWKKYLDKKVTIFKDSDIENVQLAFWELFFCLNQWVFGKMTRITAFKSDWWGIYREIFISILQREFHLLLKPVHSNAANQTHFTQNYSKTEWLIPSFQKQPEMAEKLRKSNCGWKT